VIIARDMKYNIIRVIANSVQNMNYCDTVFTLETNVSDGLSNVWQCLSTITRSLPARQLALMSGSACPQ
jgi:hypothetical protein